MKMICYTTLLASSDYRMNPQDVYDNVDYLSSLGKSQTAAVKRDAEIGVAQANRDAGIREAECEKASMYIKYTTDTKVEDNARAF